jgi:hypothetical protein
MNDDKFKNITHRYSAEYLKSLCKRGVATIHISEVNVDVMRALSQMPEINRIDIVNSHGNEGRENVERILAAVEKCDVEAVQLPPSTGPEFNKKKGRARRWQQRPIG